MFIKTVWVNANIHVNILSALILSIFELKR